MTTASLRQTCVQRFSDLKRQNRTAPGHWREPCTNTECTLHQLSPYIGKLKSSIAKDLIDKYTKKGDFIVDPFCGAGTVPLQAVLMQRNAFGADISPYARVLSQAKLHAPNSLDYAICRAESLLRQAEERHAPDLRQVPLWVREFFHPSTLREAINFAQVCKEKRESFFLACLLGILHHQRPGFLSFPSSHLVPYRRDKRYPRENYPQLYEYRELRPRLIAKVARAYKRSVQKDDTIGLIRKFRHASIENLTLPQHFDCVITSPPYMNALDYGRDNRLRMWFIDSGYKRDIDQRFTGSITGFRRSSAAFFKGLSGRLKKEGCCILIVGETVRRKDGAHPSEEMCRIADDIGTSLVLESVMLDGIPDVRRSRRDCKGVKREHILVFRNK